MNQAILFNDDLIFDKQENAWRITAQMSGQRVCIYFHSEKLKQLQALDSCTQFDLEEIAEIWFETNELEDQAVHIQL